MLLPLPLSCEFSVYSIPSDQTTLIQPPRRTTLLLVRGINSKFDVSQPCSERSRYFHSPLLFAALEISAGNFSPLKEQNFNLFNQTRGLHSHREKCWDMRCPVRAHFKHREIIWVTLVFHAFTVFKSGHNMRKATKALTRMAVQERSAFVGTMCPE